MKKICLPTITHSHNKIIQKYEKTSVAVITYDILSFDGDNNVCKKISSFYSKLFGNFSKWQKESFEKYAENHYISDTDPRKKFRYIPFELKYKMTAEITEKNMLDVCIHITLGKRKNTFSEKHFKHIWNLKNGTLSVQKTKDN